MSRMSRLVALAIALGLALTPAVLADSPAETDPIGALVEQMTTHYATYGEEARPSIDAWLEQMQSLDPDQAARWRRIMGLWASLRRGVKINMGVLPDGLEDQRMALVVLGFQLNPDGTMRDELVSRLEVARASAEKYPNAVIVCTGGGTAANDPTATEAGVMAGWLVDHGIAPERIIVEDKSMTTAQNAAFTLALLQANRPEVCRIAIISSDYHIETGKLLFEAQATLMAEKAGHERWAVVSNAACEVPSGILPPMFQAGALIELAGDVDTAYEIYYNTYTIHDLPDPAAK